MNLGKFQSAGAAASKRSFCSLWALLRLDLIALNQLVPEKIPLIIIGIVVLT